MALMYNFSLLQDLNDIPNSGELKVGSHCLCTLVDLCTVINELSAILLKVPTPAVNAVVDISNPNTLYGLRHRIVAVESL